MDTHIICFQTQHSLHFLCCCSSTNNAAIATHLGIWYWRWRVRKRQEQQQQLVTAVDNPLTSTSQEEQEDDNDDVYKQLRKGMDATLGGAHGGVPDKAGRYTYRDLSDDQGVAAYRSSSGSVRRRASQRSTPRRTTRSSSVANTSSLPTASKYL